MTIGIDVIRGAIKLDGFLEGKCFTSWSEFISELPNMLSVEIPTGITNVTVGNIQPSSSELDHLWIKTDGAGSFIGMFIYTTGSWRQIYPAPNQLFLMYGNSTNIPAGYTLASSDPNLTPAEIANLQKIWTIGGTSPTWYSVFHVTYIGF